MAGPYDPVPNVAPEVRSPNDYLNVKATPASFGGLVAQGEQELGKGAESVGENVSKLALEFQATQLQAIANENSNNYGTMISKAEADFRLKRGQDAVDGLTPFLTNMKSQLDGMANNIKSPIARQTFLQDARSFFNRTAYSTSLYAGDQAKSAEEESWKGRIKTINDFVTTHYNDPDALKQGILDTTQAAITIAHNMGIRDPAAINEQVTAAVGELVYSVTTAQIGQGETVQDRIKALDIADKQYHQLLGQTIPGSPGVPIVDAKHQDMLNNMIQSRRFYLSREMEQQANKDAARVRVSLNDHAKNSIAMLEDGQPVPANMIPSDDQIRAGYPDDPERQQEAIDDWHYISDVSHYTGNLQNMTPEQIEKLRGEIKPDLGKPDIYARQLRLEKALDSALNSVLKQRNTDPAGSVLRNNPDVDKLRHQITRDPSTFAKYAVEQKAHQDQWGIPPERQHLLDTSTATQLANNIYADPKNAPQSLRDLQNIYGSYWPQVYRDMVQLGKLPIEMQAVSHLQGRDADLLATFLSEKGAGKDVASMILDPRQRNAIKSNVEGQMTAFWRSRAASGATPEQTSSYIKATVDLAYANVYYRNMDYSSAAKSAVKAFEGTSRYLGSARIPADKYEAVVGNSTNLINTLNEKNIQLPSNLGGQGQPTKQEYIDTLKATPTWITSPNGDSLWLKDIGGRIVKKSDGQPFSVPFDTPYIPPFIKPVQGPSPIPGIQGTEQ